MNLLNERIKSVYDKVVSGVFCIILVFIILGIIIGTLQLITTVWNLFEFKEITRNYTELITGVLTLYVLIELSKSLVDYHETHEIRISFLIDAAIIFIVREIMIALFEHKAEANIIYAFSVFLISLGFIRLIFWYIARKGNTSIQNKQE
ncbi:uncharacterized membrane protein (DUF373 family) [Azomonas agilis]|uniref:Uncharacterized membrane protein (DUF373 family) n=1 Tax=Azomonas agilis TaxID=116849 RepID=A0A562J108_9GAMM|nr:phosphate-starvation-inducible PsiE family protein [Azomonas agilis]TWH76790.1 uncharacterized membrane protein (DUF373 family) [Azomonas agilis]